MLLYKKMLILKVCNLPRISKGSVFIAKQAKVKTCKHGDGRTPDLFFFFKNVATKLRALSLDILSRNISERCLQNHQGLPQIILLA